VLAGSVRLTWGIVHRTVGATKIPVVTFSPVEGSVVLAR
jgi:hypothetical protein